MNAIVANVLMHEAAKARTDTGPFKVIVLFCGAGLLVSICLASFGIDIGTGFF